MTSEQDHSVQLPDNFAFNGTQTIDDLQFAQQFATLDTKCKQELDDLKENVADARSILHAPKPSDDTLVDVPVGDEDSEDDEEMDVTTPYLEKVIADAKMNLEESSPSTPVTTIGTEASVSSTPAETFAQKAAQSLNAGRGECEQLLLGNGEASSSTALVSLGKNNHLPLVPASVEDSENLVRVGKVHAQNVDGLMVISGGKGARAVDLRSVLALGNRKVLGVVCDVFGPIDNPYYLVFPTLTQQHPEELIPEVGTEIYFIQEQSSYAIDFDTNGLGDVQKYMKFHTEEQAEGEEEEESDIESIEGGDMQALMDQAMR